jgi:hypothetical protein
MAAAMRFDGNGDGDSMATAMAMAVAMRFDGDAIRRQRRFSGDDGNNVIQRQCDVIVSRCVVFQWQCDVIVSRCVVFCACCACNKHILC